MPGFLAATGVWTEVTYPDWVVKSRRVVPTGYFVEVYVIRPLWTEPAITAITTTWTEPAITPTTGEDE